VLIVQLFLSTDNGKEVRGQGKTPGKFAPPARGRSIALDNYGILYIKHEWDGGLLAALDMLIE
jgi:hypothetical protein